MSAIGSSALSQNTLAPLGVFLDGQPNGNDPAAEAYFEKEYNAFSQLMGARPAFYNAYTDFTQDPSFWGASSSWAAWSFAKTGANFLGPTSGTVPLVGVPMADPTYKYGTVDNFYKQVISGQFDSVYTAIVDSWAGQGYKNVEFRIGYEFNGSMAWTPAANGSNNADFLAAWQRIASLIHAEGTKDGITAKTVWDPSTSNGSRYDVQSLYPGDSYVDVISVDVYGGGTPNNLVDFATGGAKVDSTYAEWAAKPANLEHYYMYENFTLGNPTPSLGAVTASGYGWSVSDTIAFAQQHGKPFAIDETGATSGQDDAVFPAWLASTIAGVQAEGVVVDHVNIWSNNRSAWDFVNGERPQEAAAWAAGFGGGSSNTPPPVPSITLSAPGTVQETAIGAGVTVVETITTTNLTGNVYVEVLTAGGAVETGYTPVTLVNGVATVSIRLGMSGDTVRVVDDPTAPRVTANSSPITITDPPTISLSALGTLRQTAVGAGVTITETITTTNLTGNVYQEVLTADGAVETGYTAVPLVNGVATVSIHLANSGDTVRVVDNPTAPTVTANSSAVTITDPPPTVLGSGPDTLALRISEDAWKGNAQFTVSVDGKQIGGTQTATTLHSLGQVQIVNVLGTFAKGSHTATLNFLNDAWGGTKTTDRNLYLTGATIDNSVVAGATITQLVQGPRSFSFLAPGAAVSPAVVNAVTVNHPSSLAATLQTITGSESDPTQPVFLDWCGTGTPSIGAAGWVRASVSPNGQFAASVGIDHPGMRSTLFYHAGSGPVVAAWSDTPR